MHSLIKKELRLYFNSPIAYIFLVIFLVFTSWFFFRGFWLVKQADLRQFFGILPWVYLFLIPALTMRLWSEEYRTGTIETLLTSSLSLSKIILGKFLASLAFLGIALLCTLPLTISIALIGPLDFGATITAYLGALLLGGTLIAIGLLASAVTNNQIVAFLLAVISSFALFIIGQDIVTYSLPGWIAPLLGYISLGTHYDSLTRGVIDTRDLVYFTSLTAFLLYINFHVLAQKK
jgi:ABC-2 type transport system permease protein